MYALCYNIVVPKYTYIIWTNYQFIINLLFCIRAYDEKLKNLQNEFGLIFRFFKKIQPITSLELILWVSKLYNRINYILIHYILLYTCCSLLKVICWSRLIFVYNSSVIYENKIYGRPKYCIYCHRAHAFGQNIKFIKRFLLVMVTFIFVKYLFWKSEIVKSFDNDIICIPHYITTIILNIIICGHYNNYIFYNDEK